MPSASSPIDLHIANHLRLAAWDLEDAKTLRASGSRNAAYHAQQASEKLLLAILTSEGVHVSVRESHLLDVLVDKLPDDHPMQDSLRETSFLSVYATTYRYPKTAGRIPVVQDWARIDKAILLISDLIDEALEHFGVSLDDRDNVPAKNPTPMRCEKDDGERFEPSF